MTIKRSNFQWWVYSPLALKGLISLVIFRACDRTRTPPHTPPHTPQKDLHMRFYLSNRTCEICYHTCKLFFSFIIFSLVFSFSLFSQNSFYKCCLFLQPDVYFLFLCLFLLSFFFLFHFFFSCFLLFLFKHCVGQRKFPLTHSKSKNKMTFDSLLIYIFLVKTRSLFYKKKTIRWDYNI